MYQVSSSTVHAHTCPLWLFVVFHTFKHEVVHRITELHLSMFVSAAVSEIRELNQNKKGHFYIHSTTVLCDT